MAFRLSLLGPVDLRTDGGPAIDTVLRRPKLVALLSYLALGPRDRYHRKDSLLGLFWPEATQAQARHALRQALYVLRRELGEDAVLTRGDEEVALNRQVITTDVEAFDAAVQDGRESEAMTLYRGELLQGFYLSQAPAFDEWLEHERTHRRQLAVLAVRTAMDRETASGTERAAAQWGRRLLELSPHDEVALRRVLELLDQCGDRAEALHLYQEFADRLATDLEIEPSAETLAVRDRIRSDGGAGVGDPSPRAETTDVSHVGPTTRQRRSRLFLAAIAGLLVAGLAVVTIVSRRATGPDLVTNRVVVVPFDNLSGDASLDHLGKIAAHWIANALVELGRVEVVPLSDALLALERVRQDDATRASSAATMLARNTSARIVVAGSFHHRAEAMEFQALLVDGKNGAMIATVEPERTSPEEPMAAVERLGMRLMGAVARRLDIERGSPSLPLVRSSPIEAYSAFIEATEHVNRFEWNDAEQDLRRAIALDTMLFEAYWILAGGAFANQGRWREADSVSLLVTQRIPTLTPLERSLLGWLRALVAGEHEVALSEMRSAAEVWAGAPRYLAGFHALLLNRPREAVEWFERISNRWFEQWPPYTTFLGAAHHMLGQYGRELEVAREAHRRHGDGVLWQQLRALIGLGETAKVEEVVGEVRNPGQSLMLAWELRAHGYPAAADRLADHLARTYDDSVVEDALSPQERRWQAEVMLLVDRPEEAHAILSGMISLEERDISLQGLRGVAEALRGNRTEAKQISERLASMRGPYLFGNHFGWSARIEAVLGERETAVRRLREAFTDGLQHHPGTRGWWTTVWLHAEPEFQSLRDHEPFQELLRPKG